MKIVDIDSISYSYDGINNVLENISFSIESGKIITIVGPNGAGKSTLLKLLTGEASVQRGQIKYFEKDTPILDWNNLNIGYVAQNSSAYANFPLKAFEVVEMGVYKEAGVGRRISKELKEKVKRIMEELDISDIANKSIAELSGGQKQKVFIARAVVSSPKIIFLDEPLSGIDTASQELFYKFIKKLRDEKGMTIVMVTHDLAIVPQISDFTVCVNIKATFHENPEEVFESSIIKEEFARGLELYLHDNNIPHRTVKRREGE